MSAQTTALVVQSLPDIEQEIRRNAATGRRALQEIAVLVHVAKSEHFETVPAWLAWCHDTDGLQYADRTAHQMAKVGGMLRELNLLDVAGSDDSLHSSAVAAPHHYSLLGCPIKSLESLAALRDEKPDQFDGLLKHWDPSPFTCKQVAAKVKTFLGEELHTLTCGDCRAEFEASDPRRKRCVDCEIKHQAKLEERAADKPARDVDRAIQRLAEMYSQNDLLAAVVEEIAPGMAFTAAMTCLDLTGEHIRRLTDVDRDRMEGFVADLEKALEVFRKLTAEAAE